MALLDEDVRRIESLGYARERFAMESKGLMVLKNLAIAASSTMEPVAPSTKTGRLNAGSTPWSSRSTSEPLQWIGCAPSGMSFISAPNRGEDRSISITG